MNSQHAKSTNTEANVGSETFKSEFEADTRLEAHVDHLRRRPIYSLTGARFFASIAVVCFHFTKTQTLPLFVVHVIAAGYLGVPFFFVLSGFILAYNYVHGDAVHVSHEKLRDRRSFWVARFARIYPAYFLALVLDLPFFFHDVHSMSSTRSELIRNALVIAVFTLTLTQSFTLIKPIVFTFNTPAWTLSVEAFFYLLFPWLATGFAALGLATSAALIAISLAWLAIFPVVTAKLPSEGTFLGMHGSLSWINHPVLLLPMFLLGMAVCRLFVATRLSGKMMRHAPSACVALLILLALGLVLDVPARLGVECNAVMTAFFGCLIFILAFDVGLVSRFLGLPIVLMLGEASYGIYILQAPVDGFVEQLYTKVLHRAEGLDFSILVIVLLVVLALVSHVWLEAPMRSLIRRMFARPALRAVKAR